MNENKNSLLKIENLAVSFVTGDPESGNKKQIVVVKGISFEVRKNEILSIVGESGSGKSVTAHSILRLLPYHSATHPTGRIIYNGYDLLKESENYLRTIRGNRISMIFQEPMTALNPLHSIEKQISETLKLHNNYSTSEIREKTLDILAQVELTNLKNRLNALPHQLSGGQRQRVMIAMALANNPDLLIADEPTTALDVTVQAQILALLKKQQEKSGMAILLITHDMTIVKKIADRMLVMRQGSVVEEGEVNNVFSHPKHSYTKKLFSSIPKGQPVKIEINNKIILKTENLKVYFSLRKSFFGKTKEYLKAVDDIGIELKEGHTLGVVGESGSGKSTLAYAILRLVNSTGGIIFDGREINKLSQKSLRPLRRRMQVVFQDPFSSLNPRMSIGQIIGEGLKAHDIGKSKQECEEITANALHEVGLDASYINRYPHEFSGGQRQRISIARALALKPSFIALDEPTSALDLSTQSEIINLLKSLQEKLGLSYMFISHDLRVIKSISHDIIVMKDGVIIEKGSMNRIFENPQTDYTKGLINTAF